LIFNGYFWNAIELIMKLNALNHFKISQKSIASFSLKGNLKFVGKLGLMLSFVFLGVQNIIAQNKNQIVLSKAEKLVFPKGYDTYTEFGMGQQAMLIHVSKEFSKVAGFTDHYFVYDTNLVQMGNFAEKMRTDLFDEDKPESLEISKEGCYHHVYIQKDGVFSCRNIFLNKIVKISTIQGQFDLRGKKIRRIRKFSAFGNSIFIEFITEDMDLMVMRLNWRTGAASVADVNLRGIEMKANAHIMDLAPITGSEDYLVAVAGELKGAPVYNEKVHTPKTYMLYRIGVDGKIISSVLFDKQFESTKSFATMQVQSLGGTEYFITGKYCEGTDPKQPGIYMGFCSNQALTKLTFINLQAISGFYQFTPNSAAKHLGDFKPGKNMRGEKFPIIYEFEPQPLMFVGDGFILQTEMYYKMTHFNNGNRIDEVVDEGHQYTHLFQLRLDKNLQILQEEVIQMQYFTTTNDKDQQVQMTTISPGKWFMRYKNSKEVITAVMDEKLRYYPETTFKINPSNGDAAVIESVYEAMQYWYGSYYRNTGYTGGKREAIIMVKLCAVK